MAHNGVLILLAPSKTMDLTSAAPSQVTTESPVFLSQAAKIANRLRSFSTVKMMRLMSVSKPIALAVQQYYEQWDLATLGKPALWSYTGDVYRGLQAPSLNQSDADWAQQHLMIASGLYGLVRPYDGVQAYRLEMKAALQVGRCKNLYSYWGNILSDYVQAQGYNWLCNCCSDEYAKPVLKGVTLPVITPVFFDTKPSGEIGQVPIYSKIMRGVYARWMIDHRINAPEQLTDFAAHGYSYDLARSHPNFPAFSRAKMVPLRFE